jgi:very-short-patch-repair endonuclease
MNESENAFATDSLDNLRRRLLDLTARNRLLNFTHGRQGNIRIIDELPDELHRMLLSEEELRFQAVSDPTREKLIQFGFIESNSESGLDTRVRKDPTAVEWARLLGYDTSYALPLPNVGGDTQARHQDKVIQTLVFPSEMETRLRGLRNRAETAIEETGANICYVAFGFLEWFERPESDKARHAPLLLVPVRIAKGRLNRANGTYNYTIAYTGEDILPNLSLREKLRNDFGLALPNLDESTPPEDYFLSVRRLIEEPQPRWNVRRWASVALFNFSKLLMYLDLDPARWPQEHPITDHAIVSRFFAKTSEEADGAGFGEEYAIDDLPDVHQRYPIIDDADSSQHSALVDAVEGKNLVIEGPPGTGKSQTITNLIAAALAQGKRVLFVAEKLAALEVVKRRLDHAGLGDFCLELHSHKTQKRKVLDDIATRLSNQDKYRHPEQIDADIARYETLKDELRGYAELINSKWKRTGLTIHEILMAASRYREQLSVDPASIHPEGYDGELFTVDVQRQSQGTLQIFADVYRQIAAQLDQGEDLQSHPWYGVGNRDLQLFDKERVCSALSGWQNALDELAETTRAVEIFLGADDARSLDLLDDIETLKDDLSIIPALHGDEILSALPHLRDDNLAILNRHLELLHAVREHRSELSERLRPEYREDPASHKNLRAAHSEISGLGVDGGATLDTLAKRLKQIERLQDRLKELGKPMAQVALSLGHSYTDVIKLNESGLSEFRALIELVVQLRPALLKLRGEWFDDDALDDLLPELKTSVDALNASRQELGRHFSLDRLPTPDGLDEMRSNLANKGVFRWLDGKWRASRRSLLQLSSRPSARFKDLAVRLDQLTRYAKDKRALEEDRRYENALGAHFAGLDTPVADLTELRDWYRSVRRHYGVGFGPKVGLGDTLLGMRTNIAKGIHSLADQGIVAQLDEVLKQLGELKTALASYPSIQPTDTPLVAAEGPLSKLRELLHRDLATCQTQLINPNASIKELETTVRQYEELESLLQAWSDSPIDPEWFGGHIDLQVAPEKVDDQTLAVLEHTSTLAGAIEEEIATPVLRDAIYRNPSNRLFEELARLGEKVPAAWQAHLDQRAAFADLTELNLDAWQQRAQGTLDGLGLRNRAALDKPDWLSNWLDYVRVRYQADSAGFGRLTETVERGTIHTDEIDAGYKLAIHDLLSRQILEDTPGLARFSGNAQLALQKQFRQCDDRLKHLQRERIAWQIAQNKVPAGSSGGRVSTYTELALLQRECTKKRRHIPLRQLVLRAGSALAALKPCFMMGPMSVAQYLAPGQVEFDLVVMDEASQMKPEDALGSIARGAQLVVVGDPNQLPPTSFFDKMIDDDEQEDSTAIAVSESILDTAFPMFEKRRLCWHYRSKHEQLIAFSNHAFYNDGLVVFPAPYSESEAFGVKFTRVPRGRFVNRRNVEEARVIAQMVHRHLLHRPEESIGVATMSADQRDQVERAVEEIAKDDPLFQEALEENQLVDEPLFIKNLENVQGDERDVILISCTYGPEEIGGRIYQRFGPINTDVGWRRLNVLFTRSKKRMHVFSSMGSNDIVLSQQSKRGVVALKNFLSFAESGHLHQATTTGRAPDSDFEVAVASALANAGFECVPQVGVAGFFIDIAVRDPGNRGRYLMGIECDGASYHSAKSVRDRDRLRQAVLERLGWRIRRIWSTDWYRNPRAEIDPIIRELNELKSEIPEEAPEAPEIAEVEEITELEEQLELLVETSVTEDLDLREKLARFGRDVIRAEVPDTPESQRLLRPAMLEALLEYVPATKSEFVERIPLYLRQATTAKEGKYLDTVLRIIEESSYPKSLATCV